VKYSPFLAATLCLAGTSSNAEDYYLSFGAVGKPLLTQEFGGFNTAGGFSNFDKQNSSFAGGYVSLGRNDVVSIGKYAVSVEFDVSASSTDAVSASFPGLPSPTFFYTTDIESQRLGVNAWTSVISTELSSLELGAGVGAQRFDITTSDGVVSGAGDDVVPYAMVGARVLTPLGSYGGLEAGARYYVSGEADIPLDNGASGNFTYQQRGFEFRLGWQIGL